jgi:sugar lactone lactonase YvrE
MRLLSAIALSSSALALAACAGMPAVNTSSSGSSSGTALRGSVHGGQNPIAGAHVYLYAINTNGYGGPGIVASSTNASVSLLHSGTGTSEDSSNHYYVTTDQYGNFAITSDYSCPSNYAHTFFYAVGGDSGSGANSAITLIAPAQACNTSATTDINEVSTIATAYAYAGFASDPLHIASSNTSLAATGVTNATNNIANLEDISLSTALATTPGTNGTVPQTEINTLANILAACVNSTGPTSTQCTTLFANALNSSGVSPADTATAALNIAHNPALSSTIVGNLYGLQTPTSPFQPALTSVPNDFTIAVSYTGGGLNSPVPLAIDAAGNVWVGNTASGANSVSEFSPVGAVISGSPFSGGGIVDPYSIAIDSSGHIWTANVTPDTLSDLSSAGAPITGSPFSGGGLNAPYQLAFDALGHIWVVNNVGSSLSEFSSTGAAITTSTGDVGGGISNDPVSLVIDASGYIWISDSITQGALSQFYATGTSAGTPISGMNGYVGGGLNDPWGLAIDLNGNVWAADSGTNANRISLFNATGTPISSPTGYTGGGLNIPESLAIDGAGDVWVVNRGSTNTMAPYPDSSISEFYGTGSFIGTAISPSTGYQAGLNLSLRIAVDGSGNVWVTNASLNSVTEFVGAGSPVVTPIVANLLYPYAARAVNKP